MGCCKMLVGRKQFPFCPCGWDLRPLSHPCDRILPTSRAPPRRHINGPTGDLPRGSHSFFLDRSRASHAYVRSACVRVLRPGRAATAPIGTAVAPSRLYTFSLSVARVRVLMACPRALCDKKTSELVNLCTPDADRLGGFRRAGGPQKRRCTRPGNAKCSGRPPSCPN